MEQLKRGRNRRVGFGRRAATGRFRRYQTAEINLMAAADLSSCARRTQG